MQSTGNNQWQNIVLPIVTEYSFYWLDMDTEGFDREEEVACTWKVEINKAQFISNFWLLVLNRGELFFSFLFCLRGTSSLGAKRQKGVLKGD